MLKSCKLAGFRSAFILNASRSLFYSLVRFCLLFICSSFEFHFVPILSKMFRGNGLHILILVSVLSVNLATCTVIYSNTWVAQVEGGREEAERIAVERDLTLLGQVGSLEGFYMFKHNTHPRRSKRSANDITADLSDHPSVIWADQQIVKSRVKRYNPNLNDPDFSKQWFIHNTAPGFRGYDHNILPVWGQGVTGKGVVVSILDDGIEYTHKDLQANYAPRASYDFNSNDNDPAPRPTFTDENRHGTRCAGEVAAVANNSLCGVGVAYKAGVGGVRMLDGDVTDAVEAASLSLNPQDIDIYSSSWGPDDDGQTVDGPAKLARKAFADGVEKGRGGLGSIYVWASGNGGKSGDSCSCDGYTNSIYTLSISSATEHGTSPWYLEYCASTLATTFSSGSMGMRKIVTTDLHGRCTESHTGTSASAPLAAGILALALDVNHNLTWRDMQHLVVRTSSTKKLSSDDFVTNAVGRKVSHKFGYGLLDALALVELARKWKTVPNQHACRKMPEVQKRPIPGSGSLKVTVETTGCANNDTHVRYLEHVKVVITLSFSRRGDLSIKLISPSGTPATLLPRRARDYSQSGFTRWEFMSVHTWGENPKGTWTLEIKNHGSPSNTGSLSNWYLVMYGTSDPVKEDSSIKEPVPACNVECQNGCTGPQADQCKECKHFRSSLDNRCVAHCSQTEYEDSVEKHCKSCSRTCATCDGPTKKDCRSCHSPLLLNNGSCVNFCPAGLYKFQKDSKTQGVCLKCDEPCLTCAGSAVACTSCSPAYKHVVSSCVHRCGDGQYPEADGQCKPCHPSCLTCNNGGAHSCTKCRSKDENHDSFLHSGECMPSCPQGFFGHAASQECHPCHSTCNECTGPSSTDCRSCIEGFDRLGNPTGACIAECPEGHYVESSNRTCLPCQSLCKQCDQADPHKCTSCRMDTFLDKHQCVSDSECSHGTYANNKTRKCENCTIGCTACHGSSETQCLTCTEGYHMYKSQCLLHCPQGTFPSSSASCSPCNAACQTCFGESDKQCLTCTTAKILLGSHCVSSCPSGWFHNQANHHCEECSPICKSCSGPSNNNCLSCKAGWKLIGSTCKSSCPSGMVESGGDKCQECHSSCLACQGPTDKDCLSCSGVKFLDSITNTCSYECPEGFYGDLDTTHCKPCSPGCSKCKNSAECISCRPGLLLEGNSCQIQCPRGFYRSKASSCEPCDGTCEECFSSPTHCTRCRVPDVLNNRKCIGVCPTGTYMLKDTKGCAPCHSSCKSCKGPDADDCTGCSESAVMVELQCMQSCPHGYYLDKEVNRCQRCGYYCASCDGGNGIQNCTKCLPPFVSYKHYCVRACPKHGWVLDTDLQKCVRCHSSCERCIGPAANNCTACAEANMNLVGFTCQGSCPSDSFPNRLTGMCERCHPTCKTCTGPGAADCQTCAKNLARNTKSGMCSSVCPHGLFAVGSGCQECHPNCKTCNGPGSVNCLSCHSGMFYYNNTCVEDCPEWTYSVKSDGIQQCRHCHPLCQSCTGPSVDSCIVCMSPLLLEGNLCVMQCSPNYSIHESTRSCQPCGNNCRVQTRDKNRSVQNPSDRALEFVLQDPHKGGVSVIAIAAASCSVIIFLIVFGVLQLRSKRRVRYMIIKASFRKSEDEDTEDRVSLIDNEEDTA